MENAPLDEMKETTRMDLTAGKDLMKKRITVWFAETQCEAFLLSALCVVLTPPQSINGDGLARDLILGFIIISTLFLATGFLLTTAIISAFWRGQSRWLYPTVAAALFSILLQILFYVFDTVDKRVRLRYSIFGACIVFGCSLVGGYFLRWWTKAGGDLTDEHRALG
ncbi:MAG TPA: hypothetical protein VGZ48_06210 [Candidatus Acidoferrales bacterium]|jgi:hypothetical protein|nr:hypothetical protein [Candidatus Acidoferrales bacterium]